MSNDRYILRYRGAGSIPAQDLERINALDDASIVDSTSRMLLIEANSDRLKRLVGSMPEWILVPEQTIAMPNPRPRLKKGLVREK